MNIVIGTDHRGFKQKEYIKSELSIPGNTISWIDVGCFSSEYCDYPLFAKLVAQSIQSGKVEHGILLCGSGVGISIAANRFAGIYAALAWNEDVARLSRQHDKANVLVLPADFVSNDVSVAMIKAWLGAVFLGNKYQKRIDIIDSFGGV